MNNLTKIVAAILVIAALSLAFVAWWLGSRPAPVALPAAAASKSAAYPVAVAAHNLDAGKAITADDIRMVTLPIDPAGDFHQVNAIVGKVPMTAIGSATPITETALASGLAVKLADGERAVAIPVDEVAAAGNRVQPGDYVDVFFTLKQGQDIDKSQSRLLVSRLRVLSYGAAVIGSSSAEGSAGSTLLQQTPSSQAGQQAGQTVSQAARTAVLATPVADVNRLLLATQSGKLMLALRNPSDENIPDVALFPAPPVVLSGKSGLTHDQTEALNAADNQAFAGVALTGLAGAAKAASARAPAPLAAFRPGVQSPRSGSAGNTVEIIRGTQRESVAF